MGLPRTKLRLSASSGTTRIYDRPAGAAHWIDGEIGENVFRDARLGKRFRELLIRIGGSERAFRSRARIGPTLKQPISSLPISGCTKAIF